MSSVPGQVLGALGRMTWTGLVLAVPTTPWLVMLWAALSWWRIENPALGWVLLGWSVGVVVTVVLPATAHPPAPGQAPSLRWRIGGWFVRYLPPPWGLFKRPRP